MGERPGAHPARIRRDFAFPPGKRQVMGVITGRMPCAPTLAPPTRAPQLVRPNQCRAHAMRPNSCAPTLAPQRYNSVQWR